MTEHKIQAVIFDFDGLILDTETTLYGTWRETFAAFGQELPLDLWTANVGGYSYETFHPMDYLEQCLGRPLDRERVNGERRTRYRERVRVQPPMPGVVEAVAEARRMGLRLGVASSSERSWVAGHLERLGLLPQFDALVCGDEVARVKPSPELYLAALDTLGVNARAAFALEDSPKGVAAAQAASLYCVAVPNSVTSRMDLGAAPRLLASLDAVPFGTLVRDVEKDLSLAV